MQAKYIAVIVLLLAALLILNNNLQGRIWIRVFLSVSHLCVWLLQKKPNKYMQSLTYSFIFYNPQLYVSLFAVMGHLVSAVKMFTVLLLQI